MKKKGKNIVLIIDDFAPAIRDMDLQTFAKVMFDIEIPAPVIKLMQKMDKKQVGLIIERPRRYAKLHIYQLAHDRRDFIATFFKGRKP